jgi:hypothetical protein
LQRKDLRRQDDDGRKVWSTLSQFGRVREASGVADHGALEAPNPTIWYGQHRPGQTRAARPRCFQL